MTLALAAQTANGWIDRVAPGVMGIGDPTLDLVPWDRLAPQLAAFGQPAPGVVIAGTLWSDTAKIAYALGPKRPVTCLGEDPRGFHFVDRRALAAGKGRAARRPSASGTRAAGGLCSRSSSG